MQFKILNHSWPAITWSVIIFILLTLPGSSLPSEGDIGVPYVDKLVHFALFGGFVYLWTRYLAGKKPHSAMVKEIVIFFLVSCAYGIGMEYYQRYELVDRQFDYSDMVADALGALAAALFCFALFRWRSKKWKQP